MAVVKGLGMEGRHFNAEQCLGGGHSSVSLMKINIEKQTCFIIPPVGPVLCSALT